jgi:hypothetical protein
MASKRPSFTSPAGVAELHPHVVGAGVAVLLEQQAGAGGHEGVAVGGLGADVEFHAAAHVQVAVAGVGSVFDLVLVGGVQFQVGVHRHLGMGGKGAGAEGGGGRQFEAVLHEVLRSVNVVNHSLLYRCFMTEASHRPGKPRIRPLMQTIAFSGNP